MHYNVLSSRAVLLKSLHQTFCVCCFSCVRKFFNDFLVINFCILSVTGFMIGSCQEIQCISLGIIQFITFSKIGNCRIIISLLICRISCFVKIVYCRNTHFTENRTIQGLCIIRKGILIDCFQFLAVLLQNLRQNRRHMLSEVLRSCSPYPLHHWLPS